MAFIPAPGVAQVNINMQWRNVPVANVLYVRKPTTSAWQISQLDELCDTVANWWQTNIRPLVTNEVVIGTVKASDLLSSEASTSAVFVGSPQAGALLQESVQNVCALCVTFNTTAKGRTGRGRNYVPGLPQNSLVDNRWLIATTGTVQVAYQTLGDDLGGVSLEHVVLSRRFNKADRVTAVARPVTEYTITSLLVATQRNRRN